MYAAPVPYAGARVQVTWTDGRVYPATVASVSQGFVNVHWDAGGAPTWVPIHAVAPLVSGGAAPAPPPPPAWNIYPAYAQQQIAAPPPAPAGRAPSAAPAGPPSGAPKRALAAAPAGPPPRPMKETIRDLPRGMVYEPTAGGPGTGYAFHVLFGFIATLDADAAMRRTDIEHIGDDVAALRAVGYRVIVDLHGDLDRLNAALTGAHPDAAGLPTAGVFWGGHGDDDGTIGTFDGAWISPDQIAPEVAPRGAVKLFVMSACFAGNHVARWQKALGPQAQIIGWGAPITNARAIEFLVPDDANARGFDDLLEKHLGARRVSDDAPLVEVLALAKQHEDRVALLSLSLEELVKEAEKRLKCRVEKGKNTSAYYCEVRTPPSRDRPLTPRSQMVRIGGMGVDDAWIHISSLVGPYTDALDLARGLRTVSNAVHVRVGLTTLPPDDKEFIIVETILRRRRLDPYTFANNVRTIGTFGDKLEDMYFGSDER